MSKVLPGEFQGEFLLPFGFHILADSLSRFQSASRFGDVIGVQFLSQNNQSGLGGFTDLLESILVFVEVNGRVVAHNGASGDFLKSQVVTSLDLLAVVEQVANGLVGGSRELEFVEFLLVLEGEHLADGHHVGGEGAGLVGADNAGATQGLNRGQRSEGVQKLFYWVPIKLKSRINIELLVLPADYIIMYRLFL